MLYIKLFFVFLQIGALSFGGGYGMISLVRESVLSNGWMTEADFLNFVAVSESTPGPLAVNMATFVGSVQGGFLGALIATFGVVLPSFAVILLIAAVLSNLLRFAGVNAFLVGIRPAVVGLVLATALSMLLSALCGFAAAGDEFSFDWKGAAIFALIAAAAGLWRLVRKKSISPILLILFGGLLGILANLLPV